MSTLILLFVLAVAMIWIIAERKDNLSYKQIIYDKNSKIIELYQTIEADAKRITTLKQQRTHVLMELDTANCIIAEQKKELEQPIDSTLKLLKANLTDALDRQKIAENAACQLLEQFNILQNEYSWYRLQVKAVLPEFVMPNEMIK